jgi:hypothetical protein
MNVIRKQFLIWRTIDDGAKAAYGDQAQALLLEDQTPVSAGVGS